MKKKGVMGLLCLAVVLGICEVVFGVINCPPGENPGICEHEGCATEICIDPTTSGEHLCFFCWADNQCWHEEPCEAGDTCSTCGSCSCTQLDCGCCNPCDGSNICDCCGECTTHSTCICQTCSTGTECIGHGLSCTCPPAEGDCWCCGSPYVIYMGRLHCHSCAPLICEATGNTCLHQRPTCSLARCSLCNACNNHKHMETCPYVQ